MPFLHYSRAVRIKNEQIARSLGKLGVTLSVTASHPALINLLCRTADSFERKTYSQVRKVGTGNAMGQSILQPNPDFLLNLLFSVEILSSGARVFVNPLLIFSPLAVPLS